MQSFINQLKTDEAGRIFWLNLCAHLDEGVLDMDAAKEVFQTAKQKFEHTHAASPPPDSGNVIYRVLCAETEDNTIAIGALRRAIQVDWSKIQEVNTIINDASWWEHYAEAHSDGHKNALEAIATEVGPLSGFDENKLGAFLLEYCWNEGKTNLADVFSKGLKNGFLKTAANRFWASIQAGDRPSEPDALLNKLALTNFQKGQWVIEIVYNIEAIKKLIDDDPPKDFKRPSALCVNDRQKPRFRALTTTEIGGQTRGDDLFWHGWTVDLAQWTARNTNPINGLPELMCPSVKWDSTNIPSAVTLIGKVETPVAIPSNKEYTEYLQEIFKKAVANEPIFVEALSK